MSADYDRLFHSSGMLCRQPTRTRIATPSPRALMSNQRAGPKRSDAAPDARRAEHDSGRAGTAAASD